MSINIKYVSVCDTNSCLYALYLSPAYGKLIEKSLFPE